jgi:hypothetical protein
MALNETQQRFLEKYLKGGWLHKKSDARKTAEYEAFLAVEAQYMDVNKRVPDGTDGKDAASSDHVAAIAYRDAGKFKKAHAAMDRVLAAIQEVENRLMADRNEILRRCGALALADDATQSEQDFFNAARQAVNTALTDERPTPVNMALARTEIDKAAKIVARSGALKDLHDRNPAAAASAHLAFEAMRAKTGGGEITQERIDAAEDAAAAARLEVLRLDTELRRAEALEVGSIDDGVDRMGQILDARTAKEAAERTAKEATDLANALAGTKLLSEALESGPLSGKGSARKMPDAAIQTLIASFEDHPRVAASAVDIAQSALDPEAVANGVAKVGAQLDNGFRSGDNQPPRGIDSQKYAEDVLKMGGTCGSDYFDRLEDYVRLGGLAQDGSLADDADDSVSARGQKRSVAAAAGMLDDNGMLALGSDEAKLSIGAMLFHPDAMARPTPALNRHTLETLEMLTTDPTKGQAETILAGVTPPDPGQGGVTLVNTALDKTGTPSATDARQVILASMLQSVDQGPVGSCFATAPARRLRELDPIGAMRKYTELAVDGTFTTADGTVVPAVTNTPPGEDPLIRGLEYSLAAAVGREDSMRVQVGLNSDSMDAARKLKDAVSGPLGADAVNKSAAFLLAIRNEFSTTYDPMVLADEVAEDGKSDRGRYILVDSGGNKITTKAAYQAKAIEVALAATGYARDSVEGQAVIKAVEEDYMDELSTKDKPPWKLASGGLSEETMVALTPGATGTRTECTAALADEPETDAEIGTRTKEILTGLIDNLPPAPEEAIPVDTVGMHDFSLMVGGSTMQDFLSGPGTTAQKIQTKLVAPGVELATTALGVEEAQKAYDELLNPEIAELEENSTDDSLSRKERRAAKKSLKKLRADVANCRPTGPVTPAELQQAVADAVERVYSRSYFKDRMQEKLVQEFSDPQIVLADTNWGDAETHTFFVVAPDPISGEPMMWEKTDPPGSMEKLDGDWLQASWGLLN